jgi:hypothetical protein
LVKTAPTAFKTRRPTASRTRPITLLRRTSRAERQWKVGTCGERQGRDSPLSWVCLLKASVGRTPDGPSRQFRWYFSTGRRKRATGHSLARSSPIVWHFAGGTSTQGARVGGRSACRPECSYGPRAASVECKRCPGCTLTRYSSSFDDCYHSGTAASGQLRSSSSHANVSNERPIF